MGGDGGSPKRREHLQRMKRAHIAEMWWEGTQLAKPKAPAESVGVNRKGFKC